MKKTLVRAANETPKQHARRMRALKKQVFAHQIDDWANDFLTDLGE